MSHRPRGEDWWLATDGKWYPPESLPPSPQPPASGSRTQTRRGKVRGGGRGSGWGWWRVAGWLGAAFVVLIFLVAFVFAGGRSTTMDPTELAAVRNALVGSWENDDPRDSSHQRVEISNSGRVEYRDDAASICDGRAIFGGGVGEFTRQGTVPVLEVAGELFCSGVGGREISAIVFIDSAFLYSAAFDVVIFEADGTCWYRPGADPTVSNPEVCEQIRDQL